MMFDHRVRVTFGEHNEQGAGLESGDIASFDLTSDMLELADPFTLTAPLTSELWDLTPPDSTVRVFIDDSQVLEGYLDERERTLDRSGSVLSLSGRDKGGRLVDESAPFLTYGNVGDLESLAKSLVAPWFTSVTLSNARNRAQIRGRDRRLAHAPQEPTIALDRREARKVEPGETTAQVLTYFLERAGLLGWSSANGREFIIGKPNYSQAPQFFFFAGAAGSSRMRETNILSAVYRESVSERYSEIQAVGSSTGDSENYGPNVTRRTATARSNALLHRKRLVVVDDDINSAMAAQARADREMRLRDAGGRALTLSVAGFGQALGGDPETRPALYACDTMARWEDEEIGVRGDYLITKVRFMRDRDGERTELSLVPRGTELVSR